MPATIQGVIQTALIFFIEVAEVKNYFIYETCGYVLLIETRLVTLGFN